MVVRINLKEIKLVKTLLVNDSLCVYVCYLNRVILQQHSSPHFGPQID